MEVMDDHIRLIWSICLVPPASVFWYWYWENVVLAQKPELDEDPNGDREEQERLSRDVDDKIDDLYIYIERNYVVPRRHGQRKEPRFQKKKCKEE